MNGGRISLIIMPPESRRRWRRRNNSQIERNALICRQNKAMTEIHPSVSAIGSHLDNELGTPLTGEQVYFRQESRSSDGGSRAELHASKPTEADKQTEAMMRLAQ